MIGTTLGHYRITEKIGEGGMGVVYRARDERLDRDVAIKVLPEEVAGKPDRLARFEREAKAVAALSHPNILEIFDFNTEGDVTYAVTELLEGETLREHLQESGGPLPWRQVQEIGGAVANGLGAAHGRGVVHRDIKPSNIFLCTDGRVKILDFGLAATHEVVDSEAKTGSIEAPLTSQGTVMGTVGYMAPEQVRGEPADHRSDIFALGCVLYEMLTGERTFKRDTTAEIMTAILREEPQSFAESGVQVAPEVAKAVQHCLEKKPERRFQSGADLAFALGSESEVTASSAVPSEPARPRQWLMPILAIAGILVVALGMVFGPGIMERFGGQPEQPPIRSIAILPLENLTGDSEQAYFVDGLHEELIATFAQISAFDKVIARTSVMGFRGSGTPIREIAKQLKVAAVLEGSVRQSGDKVRVTLQLIDARTESHLWADSFEHEFTDILRLQNEVAVTVSREVRATLTPEEDRRFSINRTVKEDAYRLYLQAVRLSPWITSEKNLEEARSLFERAIEIDPTYAEAYVGLSKALLQLSHYYRPSSELMPEALAVVEKALELNDYLSSAHSRLGSIKHWWQWDFPGAEAEYQRGIELNPNGGYELARYAELLAITGRPDEAIALAERAVELDPFNANTLMHLGWVYYLSRRFDEGIEQMSHAKDLYPANPLIGWQLAVNYGGAGRYDEAAEEFNRFADLWPAGRRNPPVLSSLVWITAMSGNIEEAREMLSELLDLATNQHVNSSYMVYSFLSVGETDRAIEYLQRAFDEHETALIQTVPCAVVDPLRSDVRFQRIYRGMGLREEWQ